MSLISAVVLLIAVTLSVESATTPQVTTEPESPPLVQPESPDLVLETTNPSQSAVQSRSELQFTDGSSHLGDGSNLASGKDDSHAFSEAGQSNQVADGLPPVIFDKDSLFTLSRLERETKLVSIEVRCKTLEDHLRVMLTKSNVESGSLDQAAVFKRVIDSLVERKNPFCTKKLPYVRPLRECVEQLQIYQSKRNSNSSQELEKKSVLVEGDNHEHDDESRSVSSSPNQTTLESRLNEMELEIQQASKRESELSSKLEDATQRLASLAVEKSATINNFEKDRENLESRLKEMESENQQASERERELRTKLDEATQQLASCEAEKSTIMKDHKTLDESYRVMESS